MGICTSKSTAEERPTTTHKDDNFGTFSGALPVVTAEVLVNSEQSCAGVGPGDVTVDTVKTVDTGEAEAEKKPLVATHIEVRPPACPAFIVAGKCRHVSVQTFTTSVAQIQA